MVIFDWKPINVEAMDGIYIHGDVSNHQNYEYQNNAYKLGEFSETGELGDGWYRNSFMIYANTHSECPECLN